MKKNDQTLGDVIREFIDAYRLSDKLNELDIKTDWEKTTGKVIAKHTRKIYINKRTLYVQLDSAALREELTMVRSRLIDALNKGHNPPIIDEIVFR